VSPPRKVDDLVRALGRGHRNRQVRSQPDLDEAVSAFRDRSLAGTAFPYVFLDATYFKAGVNRRVVSQAVVIATGVAADGHREVLGCAVGNSEDGAFCTALRRTLKARSLGGVRTAGHLRRPHRPAVGARSDHLSMASTSGAHDRTRRVGGMPSPRGMVIRRRPCPRSTQRPTTA
jgi:hypothetical protein